MDQKVIELKITAAGLTPYRRAEIEDGICFVFKNGNVLAYLEIYDDGEIGLIAEDYALKEVVENINFMDIDSAILSIKQNYAEVA